MLHILLTVLKVLGIAILVILGIILTLLLLVLFVPIRYTVIADKQEKISAKVTVSWLLHILTIRYIYNEKSDLAIKVFGIRVNSKKKKDKESDQEGEEPKEKKAKKSKKKDTDNTLVEDTTPSVEESGEESSSQVQKSRLINAIERTKDIENEEKAQEKKRNPIKNILDKIERKITDVINKIKGIIQAIKNFFATLNEKIKYYFEMLTDESNKNAIKLLWQSVKDLVKHILPKKHKIDVAYGNSDPAKLADIIGYVAMAKAATDMNLNFAPVFGEDVIEVNAKLKGRLVLFYVLLLAFKLYKDKDIRKFLDNFTK